MSFPLFTKSQSVLHLSANWNGFPPEIALTQKEFVVVDYVNDGIDTRVQSKAVDGVPDEVIQNIAEQLVKIVKGETHDARA